MFGPFLYMFAAVFYKDTCLEFDVHVFGMQFFNDIHIYISFSSRPTDPKFLTGQPEKQQINLEWPN